ncbi:hypothetical protein GCM10011374_23430 [Kocuria dechangensis]|uniref:Uncharacterized protein n=1 Tax=Kocuria dechangensis TaxID=1176249 RepID=A0A917LV26_9MICC|nr:hypothetical protein [Kocuria dechangensis]GGG59895.1 hypothetical protein GCM10011374_23430 [Kocuria dechangensis]
MAPRRSATKTEARERARRAAAESMARQQRLLELGEEFFLAAEEAEQIMHSAEQRMAEIRAKAAQDAAKARHAQAQVVAAMKGERAGVTEIGQRLELSAAEVRTLLTETSARTPGSAGESTTGDAQVPGDQAPTAQPEPVSV